MDPIGSQDETEDPETTNGKIPSAAYTTRKAKGIEMVLAGARVGEVAKALGVDRRTVSEWTKDIRQPALDKVEALNAMAQEAAAKVRTVYYENAESMAKLMAEGAAGCMVADGGQVEQEPAMVSARMSGAKFILSHIIAPAKAPLDIPDGDGAVILWRLPVSPRVPTGE